MLVNATTVVHEVSTASRQCDPGRKREQTSSERRDTPQCTGDALASPGLPTKIDEVVLCQRFLGKR